MKIYIYLQNISHSLLSQLSPLDSFVSSSVKADLHIEHLYSIRYVLLLKRDAECLVNYVTSTMKNDYSFV